MRTYYYSDERNDDFAATSGKIEQNIVDGSYQYSHSGALWKIGAFVVYRLFVTPIAWLYTKVWLGIRVKNRRAICKTDGCFLYLNHTQNIADAFIPSIAAFPKRTHVITGPETVSIKGLRVLVSLLGAVPLPSRFSAARSFDARLEELLRERCAVTIYPEAHIWPYCSFVRDFSDKSFSYPYKHDAAVVAGVVVYRQRRIFKKCHPHITVYLSDPIYPDTSLPEKQARRKLRDEAYDFMSRTAKEQNSYEYIRYEYRPADDTKQQAEQ